MSETENKLEDTRVQLRLAEQNINEPSAFRSCINAFISNGRSITFVMNKEFKRVEGFSEWYDSRQAELRVNTLARFFSDQKTISIHKKSISPDQRELRIEEIKIRDQVIKNRGVVSVYEFTDYKELFPEDSGNVLRLCQAYLTLLEELVVQCIDLFSKRKSSPTQY